jgi:hypothetical protein
MTSMSERETEEKAFLRYCRENGFDPDIYMALNKCRENGTQAWRSMQALEGEDAEKHPFCPDQ